MQLFTSFSLQEFPLWEVVRMMITMMMMVVMNASWQAAPQMFANALIFVKDSVSQMLLSFLEWELIWAASPPSAISLFCSVLFLSFRFSPWFRYGGAQWPSSGWDTRHFSTVPFFPAYIKHRGCDMNLWLNHQQRPQPELVFHFRAFVCWSEWKHGKLNVLCHFQTRASFWF